ncbi:MAG: N(2)-fixation sustaining protein CowN [Candidatus Thiodiazotropha sp.]
MTTATPRDRYVSFDGLECDDNATQIVDTIRRYIAIPDKAGQWADYFSSKLNEKERLQVDDLFFVGSQMNNIYALFEELGDDAAHELLYQVEQECC